MKYAYFNPCDGKVIQWIDTATLNYNLPDASLLTNAPTLNGRCSTQAR